MYSIETSIRVRYGETDKMGYLYYGHYPEYFEVARTDLIRSLGISYKEIEDSGIIMPVKSLKVDYKYPARYDDLLTVKAILNKLPEIKLDIDYEIHNEDKKLICKGNTVLAIVDAATHRIRRAPDYFLEALKKYF
jgi:acyl-CoA thioester hydrolase